MHLSLLTPLPKLVYDLDLLHKFAKTFPTSPFTDFIDDYCRWFKLALPEPDEDLSVVSKAAGGGEESGGAPTPKPKQAKKQRWKRRPGQTARDRRRARRVAVKQGELADDVDEEEKEELVASMTVGPYLE